MTLQSKGAILAMALLAGGVASAQKILINGGGATFPYPIYSKWFAEYNKKFPNIQINYQSQGSSFGVQQVTAGTIDFGGSDAPMTDEQLKAFQDKYHYGILHFPTVLGGNVPIYNVTGVTQQLNFTPEALAGIFLGKITKWNDPEIAKANAGVKLPNADIIVVHRSDGSGTTFVWTDYLSKVNKDWESKIGRANLVNWPIGLGAKGSEGVTGQVKQQSNSIGYVEVVYALQNHLTYGKVKNQAGQFVDATLAAVTAAAAGAKIPDDFRVSLTNAPGKDAYPISTLTYLLIPEKFADAAKGKAIKDFLGWALTDGQSFCGQGELNFARLPQALVDREVKNIVKIK
jgi:phosphate transport system substrate-binding protein